MKNRTEFVLKKSNFEDVEGSWDNWRKPTKTGLELATKLPSSQTIAGDCFGEKHMLKHCTMQKT